MDARRNRSGWGSELLDGVEEATEGGELDRGLLLLGAEGDVEHLLLAPLGRLLGLVHVLRVEVLEPRRVRVGGRVRRRPRGGRLAGHRVAEAADRLQAGDGPDGARIL